MKSLLLSSLLAASSCLVQAAQPAPEPAPGRAPNVVLILADDLGYGDLSCYGQQRFSTPNIDRLAADGMRFTQFYAGNAVCAPSRASLLTGLHCGHGPIRGNQEVLPEGQVPLPKGSVTLPAVLKSAGYATGAFGKWGMGFVRTEGDPLAHGFDRFFGPNCQRWAHRYYPAYIWDGEFQVFLPGNDMHQTVTYAPDVIHQEALTFIEKNKEKPFFLFLPTVIPHAELLPPDDEILAKFRGKFPETPFAGKALSKRSRPGAEANYGPNADIAGYAAQKTPNAAYAAMIVRLDRQVGEIVALLDRLGLSESTLIVFTSDNGPSAEGGYDPDFFASSGPLRGGKRDLYEGGIRVPFIASWPGKIPRGAASSSPAAFWDVMPTLCELAGAKAPETGDGISLVPTLLGKGEPASRPHLYWELFQDRRFKQAVRSGDWKGVRVNVGKPIELYDLKKDPAETTNVAAQHPEVVARLDALMKASHTDAPEWPLPSAAARKAGRH